MQAVKCTGPILVNVSGLRHWVKHRADIIRIGPFYHPLFEFDSAIAVSRTVFCCGERAPRSLFL